MSATDTRATASGLAVHDEAKTAIQHTPVEGLDAALEILAQNKERWATLPASELVPILDELQRDVWQVADKWVTACVTAKGVPTGSLGEGEEWIMLGAVERTVRLLRQSIQDIASQRSPRLPASLTVNARGHVVAQVFPASTLDKMTLPGITAQTWMQPGLSEQDVLDSQASAYRNGRQAGRISLVLGAGNNAGLVPGDFLHKLFVERSVVLLKPNPVNAYIGPIIEEGFRALIQRGFLQVVYGGADEGRYLCDHPLVDEIHMTGSDKTFEAIVFGPGPEGQKRKAERKPRLTKSVTAELGNITPVIVVPGPWTEEEITRQGGKLATWLAINAGFNCLAPRLIIQQRQWSHRDALNMAIRDALARIDTRKAYYPGAHERHAAFVREHPDAWQMGDPAGDELPWTYITDVDPGNTEDICFRSESFCGLYAETALEAEEISEYLAEAVCFANEQVWGTLDAVLVVHPQSLKDEAIARAVDQSIADLKYGTVLVNTFPGMAYWVSSAPWGSYPGQSIYDIQSGIGFVTNTFMFEHPVKSVVHGPFLSSPDPFDPGFSRVGEFGRKLAELQVDPGWGKLTSMFWTLMRG